MNNTSGAGKGDRPRNCFSKQFKDNYELIDWSSKKNKKDKITREKQTTKKKR